MRNAVLGELEIVRREVGDELSVLRDNPDVDLHGLDACPEGLRLVLGRRLRGELRDDDRQQERGEMAHVWVRLVAAVTLRETGRSEAATTRPRHDFMFTITRSYLFFPLFCRKAIFAPSADQAGRMTSFVPAISCFCPCSSITDSRPA